jgi:hypothetical protein
MPFSTKPTMLASFSTYTYAHGHHSYTHKHPNTPTYTHTRQFVRTMVVESTRSGTDKQKRREECNGRARGNWKFVFMSAPSRVVATCRLLLEDRGIVDVDVGINSTSFCGFPPRSRAPRVVDRGRKETPRERKRSIGAKAFHPTDGARSRFHVAHRTLRDPQACWFASCRATPPHSLLEPPDVCQWGLWGREPAIRSVVRTEVCIDFGNLPRPRGH